MTKIVTTHIVNVLSKKNVLQTDCTSAGERPASPINIQKIERKRRLMPRFFYTRLWTNAFHTQIVLRFMNKILNEWKENLCRFVKDIERNPDEAKLSSGASGFYSGDSIHRIVSHKVKITKTHQNSCFITIKKICFCEHYFFPVQSNELYHESVEKNDFN